MEITEVRIKLMDDPQERLQGFCSITFDGCFVIRDLKIIQGTKGSFVAMPSRKLTDRCPRCEMKNHLRARYCNNCGAELCEDRAVKGDDGRAKLYADIAHPINSTCRELIQSRVLQAYEQELIRSQEPGYRCTYDDYGEENYATLRESEASPAQPVVLSGPKESSHRIEPAAPQPGRPHHAEHATRQSGNGSQSTQQKAAAASKQDDFGAGIV